MEASQVPIPPLQSRAKATLSRILAAAEALLSEKLFEDITMLQIAKGAGVSVGTIYTRFPSKPDLLPALFVRHNTQVGKQMEKLLADLNPKHKLDLRGRIERVVAFSVTYHRRRRGLLRALTVYTQQNPGAVPTAIFEDRAKQYSAVAAVLVGDGRAIKHPEPQTAISFAMSLIASACKDRILFSELSPGPLRPRGNAEFVHEMSTNIYLYLTGSPSQP